MLLLHLSRYPPVYRCVLPIAVPEHELLMSLSVCKNRGWKLVSQIANNAI